MQVDAAARLAPRRCGHEPKTVPKPKMAATKKTNTPGVAVLRASETAS